MRGIIAAVGLVVLLLVAGCSGGAAASKIPQVASTPVVLGTSAAMGGSKAPSATPTATESVAALVDSIPSTVFGGSPASKGIVEATTAPTIPRSRAIAITNPGTGSLASAVCVILPTSVMRGLLNDPKKAKPTTAWVVTWTGVTEPMHGGGYVAGQANIASATPTPQTRVANSTEVIDATTGEQLLLAQYPTPK